VSAQGITTFYSENFSLNVIEKTVIGEWLMTSGLWPSRFPDLEHFDYELHGTLKYRIYVKKSTFFLQDLKEFEDNLLRFKVSSVVCYKIFYEGLRSS
jgi:hypothetical protein